MSLKEIINNDIKDAMRSKDQIALTALRAIKTAILLIETAEGRPAGELTSDEELKLLIKQAKQRKDSIEQFRQSGREDLAEKEESELKIIEKYLPKAMTTEELESEIKAIIAETGASSAKDMGKVMGVASKKFAGKADGKLISEIVKKLLG
ncbi:MAG: GatB/YqeY domain-containing protein [Bacteroidia bacterium]|nr:GatB/YqeY domain-containing protein [Bacteroidia bacterium]